LYYVHAARRLAFLVKEIRDNHRREPVNIVSHSQGTMIALLSLFYMKEMGIRGPDTVMLNSTPYRFDNIVADWLSAAEGLRDMQTHQARKNTFKAAADYLKKARTDFDNEPRMPDVDCSHTHEPRHPYDDTLMAQVPDTATDWEADIGNDEVNRDSKKWWQVKAHYRDDARGSLYINFNPQDRVIGVSAVAGIGWRGITPTLLNKGASDLGDNVKQRLFVRGSDPLNNPRHNPAVGLQSGYRQDYFYQQLKHQPVQLDSGGVLVSSDGTPVQTEENNWHYIDGSDPNKAWKIPSEKILGLIPVHGSVGLQYGSFYGDGGKSEYVWINAPQVPRPAVLANGFDGNLQPYDGKAMDATKDRKAINADSEQREDFEDDVTYQTPQRVVDKQTGKERYETWDEVKNRREKAVGRRLVSPTNHSAFLRYKDSDTGTSTVAQVLSYDLCLGRGYAWHDANFWTYLLDLADWKKSDPYWQTGDLGYERKNCTRPPADVDTETVSMPRPTAGRVDPALR
ncbi:MAG: T6SS effector phospholipase Tle3 domain-containing protein, partial [Pseudomonas sp.]